MFRWIAWCAIFLLVGIVQMTFRFPTSHPVYTLLGVVALLWMVVTPIAVVVKAVRWLVGPKKQRIVQVPSIR